MSSDNQVNYDAVLTDLIARRDKLNNAIEAIQNIVGVTGVQSPGQPSSNGNGGGSSTEIKRDTFFGMSIPDAAKKYLAMSKQAKSTQEIADGLERGGMTHAAGNFGNSVGSVLHRLDSSGDEIVRVGRGTWGLAEWYPGRRKAKPTKQSDVADTPDKDVPVEGRNEQPGH